MMNILFLYGQPENDGRMANALYYAAAATTAI